MTKKRKSRKIVPPPQPFGVQGPTKAVDVVKAAENWSEYKLSDGTSLFLKPIVAEVRHVIGKYNEQGDPIYLITGTTIIRSKAPQRLRRKTK